MYTHLVTGHLAAEGRGRVAHARAIRSDVLIEPFVISSVIVQPEGAAPLPAEIDVAIYRPDGVLELAGAPYGEQFVKRQEVTALLVADQFGVGGFALVVVDEHGGPAVFNDGCDFTPRLQLLAERSGIDQTLLIPALMQAVSGTCVDLVACNRLKEIANAIDFGEEPATLSWLETPPEQRGLSDAPPEAWKDLVLTAAHITFKTDVPNGLFKFSCAVGQGIGFGRESFLPLMPVVACRNSDLIIDVESPDAAEPGARQVIARIPADQLNADDGIAIDIGHDGDWTVTWRPLADGEAEQISGMSTEQLEQLRTDLSDGRP